MKGTEGVQNITARQVVAGSARYQDIVYGAGTQADAMRSRSYDGVRTGPQIWSPNRVDPACLQVGDSFSFAYSRGHRLNERRTATLMNKKVTPSGIQLQCSEYDARGVKIYRNYWPNATSDVEYKSAVMRVPALAAALTSGHLAFPKPDDTSELHSPEQYLRRRATPLGGQAGSSAAAISLSTQESPYSKESNHDSWPVSYTHLTLPTKRIV